MSVQLNGASCLFPIIGDPIAYVESPVWLTQTLAERGHNGICVPMQAGRDDLDAVMTGLTAIGNVDGILVTMPHKHTVYAYCATTSGRARRLGVVSVIRRNPDGSWHGDMLDGVAFVKAQKDHGAAIRGGRALLIGAGGAGSAIALSLLDEGVAELVIHDTDPTRVDALIEMAGGHGERVRAGGNDPRGFDLVFNATPLGMDGGDPLPVDKDLLESSMFVGDVIAGHGPTQLIAAAQSVGCAIATGSQMVEAVQDLMADFLLEAHASD